MRNALLNGDSLLVLYWTVSVAAVSVGWTPPLTGKEVQVVGGSDNVPLRRYRSLRHHVAVRLPVRNVLIVEAELSRVGRLIDHRITTGQLTA